MIWKEHFVSFPVMGFNLMNSNQELEERETESGRGVLRDVTLGGGQNHRDLKVSGSARSSFS
jgi:hypothetical protein